jgi:hypothetical protein
LNSLIRLGYKRPLNEEDLFALSDRNKAEVIVEDFENIWKEEVNHAKKMDRKPRLWKAIFKFISVREYLSIIAMTCLESFSFWSSVILLWIYQKQSLEGSQKNTSSYVLVTVMGGIGISSLVGPFIIHHSVFISLIIGMRLKIACIGVIYKEVCILYINQ